MQMIEKRQTECISKSVGEVEKKGWGREGRGEEREQCMAGREELVAEVA